MNSTTKCTLTRLVKMLLPILIAFILFRYIFAISFSPTASMDPTIQTYDLVISNRLAPLFSNPTRGDIISFEHDGLDSLYSKRIIGIGGDTIQFIDGYVYINDQKLDESEYIDEEIETNCRKTFTVPENCYFVMGDNRENSYDSRYWEYPYVKKSEIVSKYMFHISTHDLHEFLESINPIASN